MTFQCSIQDQAAFLSNYLNMSCFGMFISFKNILQNEIQLLMRFQFRCFVATRFVFSAIVLKIHLRSSTLLFAKLKSLLNVFPMLCHSQSRLFSLVESGNMCI